MQSGESGEDNFLAFSGDKNLVVACRTKPRHKHAEVGGVVVFVRGMRALSHCHHLNRTVCATATPTFFFSFYYSIDTRGPRIRPTTRPVCGWGRRSSPFNVNSAWWSYGRHEKKEKKNVSRRLFFITRTVEKRHKNKRRRFYYCDHYIAAAPHSVAAALMQTVAQWIINRMGNGFRFEKWFDFLFLPAADCEVSTDEAMTRWRTAVKEMNRNERDMTLIILETWSWF